MNGAVMARCRPTARPGLALLAALALILPCSGLCSPGAMAAEAGLKVVAVDVEGGAAMLFLTPEGKSLLVDTGWAAGLGGTTPGSSSADRIMAAAHKLGIRKLDYVLITHYHADHVGGVEDLLRQMPVGTFIDHGANREALPAGMTAGSAAAADQPGVLFPRYEVLAKSRRQTVQAGDVVRIGSLTLRFVAGDGQVGPLPAGAAATPGCGSMADKAQDGGGENARSLGFIASFGKATVVDLGDDTWNVEKALVCPANRIGHADLLIVSHHGSSLSNSPQLLAALAPRVAVVENGPVKGGDEIVLQTLGRTPSHPAVWQLHAATRSPAANRPADYLANLDAPSDGAYPLEMEVSADGAIRVVNGRTGFSQTYPAPGRKG